MSLTKNLNMQTSWQKEFYCLKAYQVFKIQMKYQKANLKFEGKGIKDIKETISIAEKEKYFVSVMLVEEMLKNEEEHLHWIEKQIDLIELMGVENYLRTQI
nr:unnamed protein product [Callosobruchus chinensis]